MFAAIGLAWKLGGFKEVFKLVPRWVWIALGVVVLLVVAVIWHGRQVSQFEAAVRADERAKVVAEYAAREIQIATELTKQANKLRSIADEQTRIVEHAADDLRVSGPGKAACTIVVAAPASGGRDRAVATAGDPVGSVHPAGGPDLTAVPWDDFVTLVENHDKLLIRVQAWEENYRGQSKIIAEEQK